MIPNNLPIGTKIRCIIPTDYTSNLKKNEIYTVIKYRGDYVAIDENNLGWSLNRFELVEPELEPVDIAGWYRDHSGYYTQIDAKGKITHNCPRTTIGLNFSNYLEVLGIKVEAPPQLPAGFQWPGGYIQRRAAKKDERIFSGYYNSVWTLEVPSTAAYFIIEKAEKMEEKPKFEAATSVASQPQQGEEMNSSEKQQLVKEIISELNQQQPVTVNLWQLLLRILSWGTIGGAKKFYQLTSRPFINTLQISSFLAISAGLGYLTYTKAMPAYENIKKSLPTMQWPQQTEEIGQTSEE